MISFDIFDTLISRNTVSPKGIFILMQHIISNDKLYIDLSKYVINNFALLREGAEKQSRLCVKSQEDICLKDIYMTMQNNGYFTIDQMEKIQELEIRLEKENVYPIRNKIEQLKKYVLDGERVILISDMYLPQSVIRDMLLIADDIFQDITIYVSGECGKAKYTGNLYKYIQKVENIDYKEWIHIGDNINSDVKIPERMGIKTKPVIRYELTFYENEALKSHFYDIESQIMIGISRYFAINDVKTTLDKVGYSYAAPILYLYVQWIIDESIKMNIKRLYFIARDGWILKKIADIIIENNKLFIETEYIYGSRKAWRLASLDENNFDIHSIIKYSGDNNFNTLEKMAEELQITTEELLSFITDKLKTLMKCQETNMHDIIESILSELSGNIEFKKYILKKNFTKRKLVIQYLEQTIDTSDSNFAFVELSGTGFTQICFKNLMKQVTQYPIHNFFVQLDNIWKSEDCYFHVFAPNNIRDHFIIEMLCRAPHGQTEGYRQSENGIVPILESTEGENLKRYGIERYVFDVLRYCEKAAKVIELYQISPNPSIILHYLNAVADSDNNWLTEYFANMCFSSSGRINKCMVFAPRPTVRQMKEYYYWGRYPEDYSGASFSYAINHLCMNDRKKKNILIEKKQSYLGKTIIKIKHNKKMGFKMGRKQKYMCPSQLLYGKIILYAAGKVGKNYYHQIKHQKKCCLVAWADKVLQGSRVYGQEIIRPSWICTYDYDYIIIAVLNKNQADNIIEELNNFDIDDKKIIWVNPIVKW